MRATCRAMWLANRARCPALRLSTFTIRPAPECFTREAGDLWPGSAVPTSPMITVLALIIVPVFDPAIGLQRDFPTRTMGLALSSPSGDDRV